jgi:hypothetical protein
MGGAGERTAALLGKLRHHCSLPPRPAVSQQACNCPLPTSQLPLAPSSAASSKLMTHCNPPSYSLLSLSLHALSSSCGGTHAHGHQRHRRGNCRRAHLLVEHERGPREARVEPAAEHELLAGEQSAAPQRESSHPCAARRTRHPPVVELDAHILCQRQLVAALEVHKGSLRLDHSPTRGREDPCHGKAHAHRGTILPREEYLVSSASQEICAASGARV